MEVKAIRYSCQIRMDQDWTEAEKREVHVTPVLIERDGRKIFEIRGGPTGYESFIVDGPLATPGVVGRAAEHGWLACFGTPGQWDRMFITGEEMRRGFVAVGLLKPDSQ